MEDGYLDECVWSSVDTNLIAGALAIDSHSTECLTAEAFRITGLSNPNSATQLQQWLSGKGVDIPNLQKATVEEYLQREDLPDDARKILEIRQQLGKTSIKKYVAMDTAKGADDRVRGLTQFYGANRTGRWAGRLCTVAESSEELFKDSGLCQKPCKR